MDRILKILLLEDVISDAELIFGELKRSKISFSKLLVDNKEDYLKGLNEFNPDIIISDYMLPQFDGLQALLIRNDFTTLIPFILVTGSVNEEVAVNCMKAGADDYILKGNLSRLGPAVINSINKIKLRNEKEIVDYELRKSELRLQKAQSIAHVGSWELDLSKKIVSVSEEARRIYGFDLKDNEVSFDHVCLSPLPDYRAMLDETLDRLLKYNELYEAEFKIKRQIDGVIRSIYSKAELICDPESNQIKVVGVIQDITERVKIEGELKESEKKYRRIFENVQDLYYEALIDGTIVDLSPSIEIISNGQYCRNDLIGKSMYDFYFDTDERKSLLLALQERGSVMDFEIMLKNRDGALIPCSISSKIICDDHGQPQEIIGSMRDISKRKRAEEHLKHSYAFSESLLRTIPFGMDIVDEKGIVLFQSDNFTKIFGAEAIGKRCWELYRDDLTQCIDCPLIGGIIIGKTEAYESQGVLGGRIFDISHTGMMYQGKKAMLEIFQDITDRKHDEEELIKAKDKAEESDRLKTAFLHNISHEIRTPMNAIVGFSSLLGEPDLDIQTQKSYIEILMQSSNHLLSVITDIVDISSIEANIVKIEKNEININTTLKSLCDRFILASEEKNLSLTFETTLDNDDAYIMTDSTKLFQILSNLVNNAIKFTNEGSVNIQYKVKGKFLEFCVSDTGIGIAQEHHAKIFDRFYQVQNLLSRVYEGTGLGLAISKAYVELLGGEIWLSSDPEIGTSFFFNIQYEKLIMESTSVIEKRVQEGFVFPIQKTILVAEDLDSNFKLINYFLSEANTLIIRALNGKEAVEKALNGRQIDLILMDIKMPVMDGYTAVKLIREANLSIPIIAQTAYADDKYRAAECGCNGFISKPFDKNGLLKVLCQYI